MPGETVYKQQEVNLISKDVAHSQKSVPRGLTLTRILLMFKERFIKKNEFQTVNLEFYKFVDDRAKGTINAEINLDILCKFTGVCII